MSVLRKLLRESYDLQESKGDESAYWHLQKLREAIKNEQIKEEKEAQAKQKNNSCYAVCDEKDNIVQLYQTEEKAYKGLLEFQNSHPYTEFYVDEIMIN